MTNEKDMKEAALIARTQLGELNTLCCFAGMVNCAASEHLPIEQWRHVVEVNTTGAWIAAQTVGR